MKMLKVGMKIRESEERKGRQAIRNRQTGLQNKLSALRADSLLQSIGHTVRKVTKRWLEGPKMDVRALLRGAKMTAAAAAALSSSPMPFGPVSGEMSARLLSLFLVSSCCLEFLAFRQRVRLLAVVTRRDKLGGLSFLFPLISISPAEIGRPSPHRQPTPHR